MKYIHDHDYHIHSLLSECSSNPRQTPERILDYAKERGLKRVVITDHFWDENVPGASFWYSTYHKFSDISRSLPLPKCEGVEFLFGCECEMDKNGLIGLSPERYDEFDFIIIPTTHMHMRGFTVDEGDYCNVPRLARLWVQRLDALLSKDLPFHKIGIAHLSTPCIAVNDGLYVEVIRAIPDSDMYRIFTKAAELGVGIELNGSDMRYDKKDEDTLLRPFRIAKECGCKFYYGSDAHKPEEFDVYRYFPRVIDALGLCEDDKFILKRR